jgi:thymidylate synthase ThyX
MRHRLFSYHEISRRYSKIKKEDLEILKNKFYPEEIYNELNRQIEFYNYLIESKDYKKEL